MYLRSELCSPHATTCRGSKSRWCNNQLVIELYDFKMSLLSEFFFSRLFVIPLGWKRILSSDPANTICADAIPSSLLHGRHSMTQIVWSCTIDPPVHFRTTLHTGTRKLISNHQSFHFNIDHSSTLCIVVAGGVPPSSFSFSSSICVSFFPLTSYNYDKMRVL